MQVRCTCLQNALTPEEGTTPAGTDDVKEVNTGQRGVLLLGSVSVDLLLKGDGEKVGEEAAQLEIA